jgi:threonine aldolase
MIDLRSDTVTKPSKKMLNFMLSAQVGDDVFDDDPTIHQLQGMAADMFRMEAALYCPSGTMTNQIAINVHTNPGDEIICDRLSHIYNYEGGGIARNSGVSTRLIIGDRGRFTAQDMLDNINPDDPHFPITSLVSVENSCNKGGGSIWDYREIVNISEVCKEHGLMLHLDGARLFNALIETGQTPIEYGSVCDSISICLSKGLGAPVGSLLLGSKEFIKQARRIRKVFGGGMRQAGYLAAAGIYALENNINRLDLDHKNAKIVEDTLLNLSYVKNVLPVETNIIIFELISKISVDEFLKHLELNNILTLELNPQTIRMVTHLELTAKDVEKITEALKSFLR